MYGNVHNLYDRLKHIRSSPRRVEIVDQVTGDVYCIVLYSSIYIAPLNSHRQTEALLVRLPPINETSFRSDKDLERLDDRREARAEGGRRFQREGAITAKDLDMATAVLVRGTNSSCLSMERRGRRDEAEAGSRMASRRYLGATPFGP